MDLIGCLVEVLCDYPTQGYLYTRDPETNNLLLLSNYNPTSAKFSRLTLVTGTAVQEITRIENSEEPCLRERIRQSHSLQEILECSRDESTPNTLQVSKETEQRRDRLVHLLEQVSEVGVGRGE